MVQLSRYERIEEEGESRSGNYEKESERAREGGREREPSHSCWFMARATAAAAASAACYPIPISRALQCHTEGSYPEQQELAGKLLPDMIGSVKLGHVFTQLIFGTH